MFEIIKKIFIVLLSNVVSKSNHTNCLSLSNQKCMIQPNLINLRPNEYSQDSHYYRFTVKLNKCVGSYNTLNDFSNKVCVPKKTEDLNLNMFNMITRINEPKILTKDISCKCKWRFDGKKCNPDKWWNNDKGRCECEKRQKDYIWNPSTCNCKNGKYLASIIDSSVIMCD